MIQQEIPSPLPPHTHLRHTSDTRNPPHTPQTQEIPHTHLRHKKSPTHTSDTRNPPHTPQTQEIPHTHLRHEIPHTHLRYKKSPPLPHTPQTHVIIHTEHGRQTHHLVDNDCKYVFFVNPLYCKSILHPALCSNCASKRDSHTSSWSL